LEASREGQVFPAESVILEPLGRKGRPDHPGRHPAKRTKRKERGDVIATRPKKKKKEAKFAKHSELRVLC